MSLFHSHHHQHKQSISKSSGVAVGQDIAPAATADHPHVIKKKRTFFRGHSKSESSSSLKDIIVAPRDISAPLPLSPGMANQDSSAPAPQRRLSRRLQKRQPSVSGGSGSSSRRASPNNSPSASPNYVLDKPPRLTGPDFSSHQNLYIMEDGQDDEMYTLFEIISGSRPMTYSSTHSEQSSSPAPSPQLPSEENKQSTQQEKETDSKKAKLGHSRNTSASSEYSEISNSTYETEFSDFQFDFGTEVDKHTSHRLSAPTPSSPSEGLTFHKRHMSMGMIKEYNRSSMKNEYDDCVESIGGLTTDDESDYSDYGDDWDDVIVEEGLAIQMSISKCSSPVLVVISPRSSLEL
ncbi:hypothetical protein TWF694_005680 [Orbilia ellipsospora]|uniref:Uncharacterized protein n=1 Tax=Orbilia ellipsospora TaxID=2528407 RepID=A0AAV9WRL3_9PEZI